MTGHILLFVIQKITTHGITKKETYQNGKWFQKLETYKKNGNVRRNRSSTSNTNNNAAVQKKDEWKDCVMLVSSERTLLKDLMLRLLKGELL